MELMPNDEENTPTTFSAASPPSAGKQMFTSKTKIAPESSGSTPSSSPPKMKKVSTMSKIITQGVGGEDATSSFSKRMMGLQPDAATQEKIDAILECREVKGLPKCHLMPTPQGRFWQLCKEFPMHFLTTFIHCLIPTLFGSLPVIFVCIKMRSTRNEFAWYKGSYAIMEEETTPYISQDLLNFRIFTLVFNRIFYYLLQLGIACALWDWHKCLVPILKVSVPFFLLHITVTLADLISSLDDGCGTFGKLLFVVQALCVFGNTVISGFVMQRLTRMPGFGTLYGITMVLLIGIPVLYDRLLWDAILSNGDMFKFIFAVFINGFMWEFVLVLSRMIARALAHVHESTLPCIPAVVMAMKKMLGRFVIGIMQSSGLVLAASILLGVFEFLQITSLAARDKCIYKYLCAGSVGDDPFAAMKKARLLRARNAHMETVLEICFTAIAGMTVCLVGDISVDGVNSPNAAHLLLNVFIQIATEMVVDFANCAWLTVRVKQPLVAVAHLNFKGWTVWMIVLITFSCVYMMDNVVVNVVGNAYNHSSHFVMYTSERFEGIETGNLSMPCE